MNILILTGKFGMGHWSASQSLRQQLLHNFPDAKVEVEDFLTFAVPNLADAMYKGFNLVVTHGSHLFNMYYKLTAMGHPDARPPFEGLLLDKMTELLHQHRPDAVIATHPLCAQVVSLLKEKAGVKGKYGLDLPLITCVTDVSSHPEWINQNTDCYMVPSREIREQLIQKGVDPEVICVTGIPVREEFHKIQSGKGEKRELLIMGGGLGLLPKSADFYESLNAIPDTHTTIITGRNEKLYHRLHGRWENIQVIGYTSQVWEYMAKADLIVTKPGGITLFETIFAQVPILTWPPELQQERGNARWLEEEGIGWIAEKKNCACEIQEILMDDKRLFGAQMRMGRLKEQMKAESLNGLMEVIAQNKGVAV
jgi:UDP-N-acetylglucosamine:LPS N-acetylglucosamine transferase